MICFTATIDLKRNIYHIAVNKYDTNIAIIENQGEYISGIDESNVRIYDVGRSKDDADENEVVSLQKLKLKHALPKKL